MENKVLVTKSRRKSEKLTNNDKERIIDLAKNTQLSHDEIAKLSDCERSTVTKVLGRYGLEQREIEDYKSNRADIFSGIQNKILKNITYEDIQKASLQVKAMAFGVLYDKERLERGQSTENVSIISRLANELKKSINSNDND